ncbi:MarR family transcriptional regulator [Atopobiaceae bacterium 24-176]
MYDNKEIMHRFAQVSRMADGRGPHGRHGHGHGPHGGHGPEGQCCHRRGPHGPEGHEDGCQHHGPHGHGHHGEGPCGPMSPMRGQGRLLAVLAENDGVTTRELVEVLDVRPSSLNETLGRLEGRGLVGRSQSTSDGRQVEVRITEKGRELAQAIAERDPSVMFDCLTDEEREQLGVLLDKVIAAMGEKGRGCCGGHGHGPGHESCREAE